ncbi:hypothetical protein K502DRAFT_324328 [Neoconidiobolus thromboides FSU 785]|nr:hypothetical protein K502DRAFT_324328 [Neoconidiobolus thromboides FSU 785]
MGFKGSTDSSGAKKNGQKHKNDFSYVHQKQSALSKKINSLPVHGICQRCTDIIAWRKQYGKYKVLTVAKKCVGCQRKAVKEAYHILCQECAKSKNVCAKCQEPHQIVNDPSQYKSEAEKNAEEINFQNWIKRLPERKRRSVLRKMERGDEVIVPQVEDDDDFELDLGDDFDFTDSEGEDEKEDKE